MSSTHRSSFASGLLVAAAIALTTGFQMSEPQMHPVEIDGMAGPATLPTVILRTDYTNYALVEPKQVTVVFSRGYEIRDENYRLVPNPTLPRDGLRAALHEMSRFYR